MGSTTHKKLQKISDGTKQVYYSLLIRWNKTTKWKAKKKTKNNFQLYLINYLDMRCPQTAKMGTSLTSLGAGSDNYSQGGVGADEQQW